MTCYYPLNLFLGISSHVGRVTIACDLLDISSILLDVFKTFFLVISFVKELANSLSVRAQYTLTVPFRAL